MDSPDRRPDGDEVPNPDAVTGPEGEKPTEEPAGEQLYRAQAGGLKTYLVLGVSQVISLLGSSLVGFAVGIWLYERNGSVTEFALIALFTSLPGVLLSPVAGTLVDRWDLRRVMIFSDLVAALGTVTLGALYIFDSLSVWHIYALMGTISAAGAFQFPAQSTVATLLVPKREFSRMAGLRNFGQAGIQLLAPVLGAYLLVSVGLPSVLLIDLATFVVALVTLMFIRIPDRPASSEVLTGQGTVLGETLHGWRYLRTRPGLLGLLLTATAANFALGLLLVLGPPMVLGFSSVTTLGTLLSIAGIGTLAGALVTTVFRAPKRRLEASLGWMALSGLFVAAAGLRPSIWVFGVAAFLYYFSAAIAGAYAQAIWQSKIAPDIQGRVFSIRRLVGWASFPVAYGLAGPLAEQVFEPLMVQDGPLAQSFGRLLGTGEGRGLALLLLLGGLFSFLACVAAYLVPRVRNLETEIPEQVAD